MSMNINVNPLEISVSNYYMSRIKDKSKIESENLLSSKNDINKTIYYRCSNHLRASMPINCTKYSKKINQDIKSIKHDQFLSPKSKVKISYLNHFNNNTIYYSNQKKVDFEKKKEQLSTEIKSNRKRLIFENEKKSNGFEYISEINENNNSILIKENNELKNKNNALINNLKSSYNINEKLKKNMQKIKIENNNMKDDFDYFENTVNEQKSKGEINLDEQLLKEFETMNNNEKEKEKDIKKEDNKKEEEENQNNSKIEIDNNEQNVNIDKNNNNKEKEKETESNIVKEKDKETDKNNDKDNIETKEKEENKKEITQNEISENENNKSENKTEDRALKNAKKEDKNQNTRNNKLLKEKEFKNTEEFLEYNLSHHNSKINSNEEEIKENPEKEEIKNDKPADNDNQNDSSNVDHPNEIMSKRKKNSKIIIQKPEKQKEEIIFIKQIIPISHICKIRQKNIKINNLIPKKKRLFVTKKISPKENEESKNKNEDKIEIIPISSLCFTTKNALVKGKIKYLTSVNNNNCFYTKIYTNKESEKKNENEKRDDLKKEDGAQKKYPCKIYRKAIISPNKINLFRTNKKLAKIKKNRHDSAGGISEDNGVLLNCIEISILLASLSSLNSLLLNLSFPTILLFTLLSSF